ncbi:zinc metalloproteinase-disintegrin-like agkihagin [Oscarella lobularis]|uniref:zinc metalloproteinase-disintegrin-like agkihagin n=1 Tax=Oscarella lobularis TaxID=121494 RepID=UPI0033144AF9
MPRTRLLLLFALQLVSGLRVDVHRAEDRSRRTPDVESKSNRYLTLRVDKNDGTNPWLLDLEESSKDFLSSRFVTRHFDATDAEVLTREYPACHYRGQVRDVPDSHVVISTCGGINGIIHDGKRTYNIQPDSDGAESSHLLSESASDEITSYCGVTRQSPPSRSSLKPPHQHQHHVAKRSLIYPYTVELTFVADSDLYKNVKENVTELQTILLRFANVISAIYKRSDQGVRVVLIAIEVWSNGNQAVVLSDFKTTLQNFVTYNGETLQKNPLFKSDNTQLLTGIDFTGSTKGFANVDTICQGRTSAAVVEVYSLIGADVAGIMAHEMGHNFGMQHDDDIEICECSDPDGCVMSAVLSGRERNFTFSECSRAKLKETLDKGQGSCLTNLPEKIEGPVTCGNGFVEPDEECDCGTVEECTQAKDQCCNPRTCTLYVGAACSDADDICCKNCQFAAVGKLCRSAKGDCDLEEVCTGVSARCPTNLYKYDGMNCTGVDENDMGICYRGVCNTRTAQCRGFWGSDAVTGSSRCYKANLDGKFYGYCGGNPTDGYIPCEEANVMCGKLQCLSPLETPTVSRAWRSATYRVGSETCRSISVTVEDDERDPGFVGDGTACGNGMICILNECVDVPTGSAQCPRDDAGQLCSNNGICSSAGTCVCSDGFTSDDCSGKLGGGNAGVIAGVIVTLILLLIILFVLIYFYPNTFFRPCPSLRPGCLEKGDGASSSYNLSQRAPSNNGKSAARAPPAKPPPPPPSSRPPARPRPPVPLRPNNVYNKPVNA